MSYRFCGCLLASSHRTCMVWFCMYSLRLLMMDGEISETCRMLFQNKINLRYCASGWFYYRNRRSVRLEQFWILLEFSVFWRKRHWLWHKIKTVVIWLSRNNQQDATLQQNSPFHRSSKAQHISSGTPLIIIRSSNCTCSLWSTYACGDRP